MTSSSWQLVFHPVDAQWCPPHPAWLRQTLRTLQLIGEPYPEDSEHHYLIGPTFLNYISFMGCAPAVAFAPAEGNDFIHWFLSPCLAVPRWIVDWQQALPRCGHCHGRIPEWRTQLDPMLLQTGTVTVRCPNCQYDNQLDQLDWRHGAGQARQYLSVLNIYPKEALPTDALLTLLQQSTATSWNYFYCQHELIED